MSRMRRAGHANGEQAASRGVRFRSVASESLPRRVGRELIGSILSGDLASGDELPSEDQLAKEFGVSRPVVREAVRHLRVLGLVKTRQGRQARVAPYEEWNHFAPDLLVARRDAGAVEDVLLELLELRRMIEVEAAASAAHRATPADLDALRDALDALESAVDDIHVFTSADIQFHDAILHATQNHLLPRLFDLLRPLLEFGREISISTRPQGTRVSQAGHRAVYEAICAGSAEDARRHMEEHLSWTANLDFSERAVRLAIEGARSRSGSGGSA